MRDFFKRLNNAVFKVDISTFTKVSFHHYNINFLAAFCVTTISTYCFLYLPVYLEIGSKVPKGNKNNSGNFCYVFIHPNL